MLLPSFVSRQAGRLFPSLPSTDELRRTDPDNRIRTITHWIYDTLKAQKIAYERDEVITPGPSTTQLIRTPWEIRAYRQGTCLDLALLFCGVCATYELLPIVLLFEDHALAAVCNTHDLAAEQQHKRKLYDLLANNNPSQLFKDRPKFLAEIIGDYYLAVECTGFAVDESLPAPEGHKREDGQLSFEAALLTGQKQLERTDCQSFHAIDVSIAWHVWGVAPAFNQPEGPAPQLSFAPPTRVMGIGADVEFVGREKERQELHEFLKGRPERPADFHWALWTAPGGQGKTRLAWRLCREAQKQGWNAGFLSSDDFTAWSQWQVTWPTLVVIDQIAYRPEKVSEAIRALSQTPNGIIAPLRLLLLERAFKETDPWVENFAPAGRDASLYLFENAYPPGTSLTEVARPLLSLDHDEIWEIITTVLDRLNKPHPGREETLSRFRELDPAFRPLFAILVAEAIAEHGSEAWRRWNREQLGNWVLKRDFSAWKSLLLKGANPGNANHELFEQHLNAVIVATIAGGQTAKQLAEYRDEFGVPLPARLLPDWLRTMTPYTVETELTQGKEIVPGLSPDILGELFVLERLAGAFGADTNQEVPREQTKRILDVALALEKVATVDFIVRAIHDFGDHPSIIKFGEIDVPEGDHASYGLLLDHAIEIGRILERVDRPDLGERLMTRLIERAKRLLASDDHESLRDQIASLLANGLYNRGIAHQKREDFQSARPDFDEAIATLDSQLGRHTSEDVSRLEMLQLWAAALRARAFNRWSTGDQSGAFQDLERLLHQADVSRSERAEGLLLRGQLRERTDELVEAISDYEEIIAMKGPRLEEIQQLALERLRLSLHALSIEHKSSGDFDSAYDCLSRVIELAACNVKHQTRAQVDRGELFIQLGKLRRPDLEHALADFNAVLNNPGAPEEQLRKARINRGQVFLAIGDFKSAKQDVSAILKVTTPPDRSWAMALLTRAQIHWHENEGAAAFKDLRAILDQSKVDPDLRQAAEALANKLK